MVAIFANNATGKLGGDITTSSTTLILQTGNGILFPSPTGGNYFPITVVKSDGTLEIMKCTERTSDILTVTRSQEGTTAKSFSIGDRVSLRITAKSLSDFVADKQPLNRTLTAISNMVVSADEIMYATGPDSFALTALTKFARSILDDADAASVLATIGAVSNRGLAGMVVAFAMQTAPSGFLKANGAAVSRTLYADLFAAIGTTFGAGDESTTFNLPDFRGEHIRGWDDGRGVDSGRVFGSWQDGQNLAHSHNASVSTDGHTHTFSATSGTGGGHNHATSMSTSGGGTNSSGVAAAYSTPNTSISTNTVAAHTHTVSGTTASGSHTHTVTNNSNGGTEVRVRNKAMLYCIKY